MAMTIGLAMSLAFAQQAWAEIQVNATSGAYQYKAWLSDDGSMAGSVAIDKYTGSATKVAVPSSFTYNDKTYSLYNASDPDEPWCWISGSAFGGVKSTLQGVAIPAGVNALESGAFAGFSSLKVVAIGNTLSQFGDGTFSGSPNLKTYYISATPASGGYNHLVTSDADTNCVNPGIGQDANGNILEGVTVYCKAGSEVEKHLKYINSKSKNGNQITIITSASDPYAKALSTDFAGITPDGGSGNTGGGGGGGGGPLAPGSIAQLGEDGTALGKGASEATAEARILTYSDEKDPAGSVFYLLKAKVKKATAKSVKLGWTKVAGAKRYVVFGNMCGKKYKYVKLTTTSKTSITFKKVNGKAVKKGTYYKFIVVALDSKGAVVSSSKTVHVATPGGKVGNDKKVTTAAKKNKVTVKVGKKFNLKGKATPVSKSLKVRRHRNVAYESTNPKIATVSAKGVVKGIAKGTCDVYAYAQNGVFAKVKVTVK
ncbi:MAG: Ig-like domain-containing protein [Eggerthellaceae bacterium]|nr:Ig-like domain-containing protein [Eggerthellaceae bacterium]